MAANHIRRTSEPVDGAAHAERTTIEHVRVHHRRTDVRVPEQLLHGSNVVPILEQVCCEGMPECVWTRALRDAGLPRRLGDGLLNNGFVKMKAGRWPPSRIRADARRRKDKLPSPLDRAFGYLRSSANGRTTRPNPRARTIQLMLGHADIKQTQRYLNITDEELRKAMTGVWERRRQLRAVSQ